MKKHIMFYFSLAVILLIFYACDLTYTDYSVQYLRIGYYEGAKNQYPIIATVVSSEEELEQYITQYYLDSYEEVWINEKYSNDYFINNFLVFVYLGEGSSSVKHTVDKISNNREIIIKRVSPNGQNDDILQWIIIVELNNNQK